MEVRILRYIHCTACDAQMIKVSAMYISRDLLLIEQLVLLAFVLGADCRAASEKPPDDANRGADDLERQHQEEHAEDAEESSNNELLPHQKADLYMTLRAYSNSNSQ